MTYGFFPCTIGVQQSVDYLNPNSTLAQGFPKVSELN
jgi:hypothetical protein